MLTEKDYCDLELTTILQEVGMSIKNVVATSPCGAAKWYSNVTLYEAQKFLREEKGVIVEVFVDDDSDTPITYNIYKDGECVCHHHGGYWSVNAWNVALSEGIKEAVKILKEHEAIHK